MNVPIRGFTTIPLNSIFLSLKYYGLFINNEQYSTYDEQSVTIDMIADNQVQQQCANSGVQTLAILVSEPSEAGFDKFI